MKRNLWILLIAAIFAGCASQANVPNAPASPLSPTSTIPLPTEQLRDTPKQLPLTPQQLPATPQPSIEATSEEPDMSPLPTSNPSPDLNALTETAIQDLAQRLSIEASQIELLEAKEVVWSNSSLGCPHPGFYYADVLTPGYLIRLSANQTEYEYHAGRGGNLIYCKDPQPPVSGAPGDN